VLQHPWAGMGPSLNCTCMLIHGACKKERFGVRSSLGWPNKRTRQPFKVGKEKFCLVKVNTLEPCLGLQTNQRILTQVAAR
jgi:hypothetical protein